MLVLVVAGLLITNGAISWAGSRPGWERDIPGHVHISDYTRQVLAPLPERAVTWGSLYFGVDAGVRTELVQFQDALNPALDFKPARRERIVPDFLVLSLYDFQYAVPQMLLNQDNALGTLPDFSRCAVSRAEAGLRAPIRRGHRLRTCGETARRFRSRCRRLRSTTGSSRQWSTRTSEPLPVVFRPARPVTARIRHYTYDATRAAQATVAADLEPGFYLIDVEVERVSAEQEGFFLASGDLQDQWRSGDSTPLAMTPYLVGSSHACTVVDHPGGPLYLSRFEKAQMTSGAIGTRSGLSVRSIRRVVPLVAPTHLRETVQLPPLSSGGRAMGLSNSTEQADIVSSVPRKNLRGCSKRLLSTSGRIGWRRCLRRSPGSSIDDRDGPDASPIARPARMPGRVTFESPPDGAVKFVLTGVGELPAGEAGAVTPLAPAALYMDRVMTCRSPVHQGGRGRTGVSEFSRPFAETVTGHFWYAWAPLATGWRDAALIAFAVSTVLAMSAAWLPRATRPQVLALVMPPVVAALLYQVSLGLYGNSHTGYAILAHVCTVWAIAAAVSVVARWIADRNSFAGLAAMVAALALLVACDIKWLSGPGMWESRAPGNVRIEDFIAESVAPLPERASVWGSLYFGLDSGDRLDLTQLSQSFPVVAADFRADRRAELAPDYLVLSSYETDAGFVQHLAGKQTIEEAFEATFPELRYRVVHLVYAPPYGVVRHYEQAGSETQALETPGIAVNDGTTRQWSSRLGPPVSVSFTAADVVTAHVPLSGLNYERRALVSQSAVLPQGFYLIGVELQRAGARRFGYMLASIRARLSLGRGINGLRRNPGRALSCLRRQCDVAGRPSRRTSLFESVRKRRAACGARIGVPDFTSNRFGRSSSLRHNPERTGTGGRAGVGRVDQAAGSRESDGRGRRPDAALRRCRPQRRAPSESGYSGSAALNGGGDGRC